MTEVTQDTHLKDAISSWTITSNFTATLTEVTGKFDVSSCVKNNCSLSSPLFCTDTPTGDWGELQLQLVIVHADTALSEARVLPLGNIRLERYALVTFDMIVS